MVCLPPTYSLTHLRLLGFQHLSQLVPIFCTFCLQLGKPFPALPKMDAFKYHLTAPSAAPTPFLLSTILFFSKHWSFAGLFVGLPTSSPHPGTLRTGTWRTAPVSSLAYQTRPGHSKLSLKSLPVNACLQGWVLGDLCGFMHSLIKSAL